MRTVLTVIGPMAIVLLILIYAFFWYNNKNNKIRKKFTIWLIFTVSIGLMPIILNTILVTLFLKNTLSFSSTLSKGELFIVSVAIGSDAIGRVFESESKDDILSIVPAGGCFILVLLSSFFFAIFSAPFQTNLNTENVPSVSTVIFFMTTILSAVCVLRGDV